MRAALAVLIVGVAAAGAIYFSSLKLNPHGSYQTTAPHYIDVYAFAGYWKSAPYAWQLPLAIVVGTVGVALGLVVYRGRTERI